MTPWVHGSSPGWLHKYIDDLYLWDLPGTEGLLDMLVIAAVFFTYILFLNMNIYIVSTDL